MDNPSLILNKISSVNCSSSKVLELNWDTTSYNFTFNFDFNSILHYFLIRKRKQKERYLFILDKREEKQMDLIGMVYWASPSRLRSFLHHVVRDIKLKCSRKTVCANEIQQVYRVM